jgi:hypothetical protein
MIISLDLSQKIKAAEKEIRDRYDRLMIAVAAPYSPAERESWHKQLKEADDYMLNPNGEYPLIRSMADSRGISVTELVIRIKQNDRDYSLAIGRLLGEQQRELDKLKSIKG